MKKEDKKKRISWFGMGVIILCAIPIVFAVCVFCKEIVPKSRTQFRSYAQFVKATDWTFYEPTLPDSAHDMRYYYYEGYFSDMSGYHATFSAEDYGQKRAMLLDEYRRRSPIYLYNGVEKVYLNREQIKEARVDFLDKLLPEDKDDGQFYFITCHLPPQSSGVYSYMAVLCNDSTYEIIELSCRTCD